MSKEKGVIHIPAVLFLVGVLVLSLTLITSLKQSSSYDQSKAVKGTLIAKGDDNKDARNDDIDNDETDKETPKPASTSDTSEGVRIETKDKDDKQKTEIRFGEGEKIKTRIEEGRMRIDVTSGGVKVRYEIRDGRVTIKAETKEGEEVEDEEIVKIVDRLDKTGIKVATEGGRLLVTRNNVGALANFPLQIDLATNQLIASTSAGTRVLTVLPDQAVQNMLAANVISRLGPPAIRQAVESGEATSAAQIIQLGLRAGVPVYEILGIRDFRLLGFIPVSAPVTAVVSAETGALVTTDQPLLTRIVDLLSP